MSRKLEIYTDHNDQPRFHTATAILEDGICTVTDAVSDLFINGLPEQKIPYTSEYAMIQQIVRDYCNGYMVVDKGALE